MTDQQPQQAARQESVELLLYRSNRRDGAYVRSGAQIAKAFVNSRFYSTFQAGWPLDRALRAFITARAGRPEQHVRGGRLPDRVRRRPRPHPQPRRQSRVSRGGRPLSLPTDYESAQGALDHVRALAARLDVDHPDADYQAQKADQLAGAAHQLAHDLRLLGRGRRMRSHLAEAHQVAGLPEAAALELAEWLADHDARHAVSPRSVTHPHPHDLEPFRDLS